MKRTLPFIAPVVDSTQSAMQRDLYDKSIDLYGEGQYGGWKSANLNFC